MCGRYAFFLSAAELAEVLGRAVEPAAIGDRRYNAAPSQPMPVLTDGGAAAPRLTRLPFGWPAAAGGRPPAVINARGETVGRLPMFRSAWAARRCLVLASGFFEWRSGPRPRQPWYFSPRPGGVWGLAGIWRPEGFVIITRQANAPVAPVHPRMPQVVPREAWDTFLRGAPAAAAALIQPVADTAVAAWPVARAVNRPGHDAPDCVEPAAAD